MPPELLLDYIERCKDGRKLSFMILFHCAPVLKGVKASNMITLPQGGWLTAAGLLQGSDVRWHILSSGDRADVMLLYRRQWVKKLIEDKQNRSFLAERGYQLPEAVTDEAIIHMLEEIRDRYDKYTDGEGEFPHELGILLQYPLDDVRAFIENRGEGYLLNGYWKVYHNPERARAVFNKYNRVREIAAGQFVGGCEWKEIIV
ncbi:DUF3793 family protein [Murimonas intestini]|uniref:DUF3793 family protein n=1 Tax=Murimonas intestini TaxID=1337051 RepID=UPI0016528664|nr:DUF3793 family protein [Murimonas intestini]